MIILGIFNVFSCVFALSFFIMFNMKGNEIRSDKCLLLPWMILSSLFTFFMLIGACILTHGFSIFCKTFNRSLLNGLNSKKKSLKISYPMCRNAQIYLWDNIDSQHLFDYLMISNVSVWLLFVILLLINVVILLRILFVIKYIEYQLHDQELLIIKYARILRMRRINQSYNIQLPMVSLKKDCSKEFKVLDLFE